MYLTLWLAGRLLIRACEPAPANTRPCIHRYIQHPSAHRYKANLVSRCLCRTLPGLAALGGGPSSSRSALLTLNHLTATQMDTGKDDAISTDPQVLQDAGSTVLHMTGIDANEGDAPYELLEAELSVVVHVCGAEAVLGRQTVQDLHHIISRAHVMPSG